MSGGAVCVRFIVTSCPSIKIVLMSPPVALEMVMGIPLTDIVRVSGGGVRSAVTVEGSWVILKLVTEMSKVLPAFI